MSLVNLNTCLSLHLPGLHCIRVVDHIKNGRHYHCWMKRCWKWRRSNCFDLIQVHQWFFVLLVCRTQQLTQHGFQNFSLQSSKLTIGQTKMMSLVPLPLLYFLVKVATGYSLSEKRVWCAHCNSVYNNSTDPNGCAKKVTSGCVIVGTSKLTAINMRHEL